MTQPVRSLAAAALVVAVIATGLLYAPTATADTHSATRAFDRSETVTGGEITVTITAGDFGPFARVSETLPDGWTYTGSSLSDAAVSIEGSVVRFILLDEVEFSYTVTAPDDVGTFAFSGQIEDSHRDARTVGGAEEIAVHINEALLVEIEKRDKLISEQRTLLNAYRCQFDVDTNLVIGGCEDGVPIQLVESPTSFTGIPNVEDVLERDRSVAEQEALLNAYRCRFGIDTGVVLGGCNESEEPDE